jgi:DNA-3-methyladenine glycosylase II
VLGEVFGAADPGFVRAAAQRILSLDHDGTGFAAVGQRDPVVGRLQERFAGLRPVLFLSPYEAAAWALIGHRIRIVQAAGVVLGIVPPHAHGHDVGGAVPADGGETREATLLGEVGELAGCEHAHRRGSSRIA